MRILCCLNRDLASNVALNLLLPALASHEVRVGLTERVGAAPAAEHADRRELRIAEQTIPNELFFPLIERAALPDNGARFLTFAEIDRHRRIPIAPLQNPNSPSGLQQVQAFAPDLIITIRYGAILKSALIAIPQFGVLNLHSGLLPSYRGVLAVFRALSAGDAEIGCTLHYISDPTIDTGAIIDSARLAVVPGKSLLWHILALYPIGVRLIAAALASLSRAAPLAPRPQAGGDGSYYTYPSNEEWDDFRRSGWATVHPSDLHAAFSRYAIEAQLV